MSKKKLKQSTSRPGGLNSGSLRVGGIEGVFLSFSACVCVYLQQLFFFFLIYNSHATIHTLKVYNWMVSLFNYIQRPATIPRSILEYF